jgi:hypothetical protein
VTRARPERCDLADDVAAEPMWIVELSIRQTASHPDIKMVQRNGAYGDEHLAGARISEIEGLSHQHVDAAVCAQDDSLGLHRAWRARAAVFIARGARAEGVAPIRVRDGRLERPSCHELSAVARGAVERHHRVR